MIVSIVTFKLPKPWTVAEAATVFKSTAPKYLGKPGLVRKHYYITEAGDRAGGILGIQGRRRGVLHTRLESHGHREVRSAPRHPLRGGSRVSGQPRKSYRTNLTMPSSPRKMGPAFAGR